MTYFLYKDGLWAAFKGLFVFTACSFLLKYIYWCFLLIDKRKEKVTQKK